MNAHPAVRIARIISRRRLIPGSPARRWRRRALTLDAVGLAASGVLLASIFASASSAGAPGPGWAAADRDGLGIRPGAIKHVWLIILENKSYDATFTGLNNNTYLWQTLPSQGVLLKNYGTGHFSLDNYRQRAAAVGARRRHADRLVGLRRRDRLTPARAVRRRMPGTELSARSAGARVRAVRAARRAAAATDRR